MQAEQGLAPAARILVIGASRGIGLATCRAALAQGYRVRAFARNITAQAINHPDYEAMRGDALDPGDVARALAGCDAVVLTLGVKADPATLLNPVTLFSRATQVLLTQIRAAADDGARPIRLIAVTGYGVGDSRRALPLPERVLFEAVMGRVAADKERQESLIRASDTAWTILRPGFLTRAVSCPRARIRTDPREWRNGFVSRDTVADTILSLLRTGDHVHEVAILT